jgi:hypothetical protein
MSEYERLVQDRRDADRARNNDWKARAVKADAALRERDAALSGIIGGAWRRFDGTIVRADD